MHFYRVSRKVLLLISCPPFAPVTATLGVLRGIRPVFPREVSSCGGLRRAGVSRRPPLDAHPQHLVPIWYSWVPEVPVDTPGVSPGVPLAGISFSVAPPKSRILPPGPPDSRPEAPCCRASLRPRFPARKKGALHLLLACAPMAPPPRRRATIASRCYLPTTAPRGR